MIHDNFSEFKKFCNSCKQKEKIRIGIKPMSEIKVLIEIEKNIHAKIEEICINLGIGFTEYFLKLHNEQFKILGENNNVSGEQRRKGKDRRKD